VILSYAVDELPLVLDNLKLKDENIEIKTGKKIYKKNGIVVDEMLTASIDIKRVQVQLTTNGDSLISATNNLSIFKRIDGNHRLSAADEAKNDQNIQDLITPFCLLLLPKQFEMSVGSSEEMTTDKLEKIIFHNINYKHISLKKEHHYKIIIGDKTIFTDPDLTEDFGEEYYFARYYLKKYKYEEFGGLKNALMNNKYTFTHDLHKLLLIKDKVLIFRKEINEVLKSINTIYSDHLKLSEHKHYGLLVAFVYFAVRTDNPLSKKELNAFATWVVENFVYKIAEKDAKSIIAMYEKIIEKRYKEIFISMDFSTEYQSTYQAIEGVVELINTGLRQDIIKLTPMRIDQFETGYSYKLDNEIFKQIEKCGLMIADLSSNNSNVYQEVGFAMGLNRNSEGNNILLLKQDEEQDKSADSEVGFNLRSTKQLRFKDTENLREILKEELMKYYALE
jgi:hypothetical protein